jgi:trehalose/maltose transport system substrate-binding protein
MTRRDVQVRRSIEAGNLPTHREFYRDPELLSANPHYARLYDVFQSEVLVTRPSTLTGKAYDDVSRAYSGHVHAILTGDKRASVALAELEQRLVALTGFEVGR